MNIFVCHICLDVAAITSHTSAGVQSFAIHHSQKRFEFIHYLNQELGWRGEDRCLLCEGNRMLRDNYVLFLLAL